MKQKFDKKFYKLESFGKDGITYLKFMLDDMFCMTNNFVAVLKTFLMSFAERISRRRYGRMCWRFRHRLKR